MTPVLHTERLILRGFRESDLDAFAAFYADEASARWVGGVHDRAEAWRRMAAYLGHWALRGFGFFALEDRMSGAYAGWCGLWRPEGWPENEMGWALAPAFRGRGLMNEAGRRVRAFAYQDLGWTTLVSYVRPNNHPSARVAERLGARREGQLDMRGSPIDVWRHPGPAELEAA